jgi:hypothetical protein
MGQGFGCRSDNSKFDCLLRLRAIAFSPRTGVSRMLKSIAIRLWTYNVIHTQFSEKIQYCHCRHALGCSSQPQTAVLSTDAGDLAILLASSPYRYTFSFIQQLTIQPCLLLITRRSHSLQTLSKPPNSSPSQSPGPSANDLMRERTRLLHLFS